MSFNVDAFVANARFNATRFREGYDVVEVDDFLDSIVESLRVAQPQMLADLPQAIMDKQFQAVQFKEGYDMSDVDDFLDELAEQVRSLAGSVRDTSPGANGGDASRQNGFELNTADHLSTHAVPPARDTQDQYLRSSHSAPSHMESVPSRPSKLAGLIPYLAVEFPDSQTKDGYSKRDVDNFVDFLVHATADNSSYTAEEVLRAAEHASPGSAGLFSKGYDRQSVDAFHLRIVTFLKTL